MVFFVTQDIFWALKLKCFLSSGPATDGMDGQALKLENTGLTFSIFFLRYWLPKSPKSYNG